MPNDTETKADSIATLVKGVVYQSHHNWEHIFVAVKAVVIIIHN